MITSAISSTCVNKRVHQSILLMCLVGLLISSCSHTTEPQSGRLSGRVILINDSEDSSLDPVDFYGVTVALYELAELDSTIVRINQEYPQIGVKINQETEFDHRRQNPIQVTATDHNGNFIFGKIQFGTYNLVFFKEGWGLGYVYQIQINSDVDMNDTNVSQSLCLYPERVITSPVLDSIEFKAGRSYFVNEDTSVIGDATLRGGARIFLGTGISLSFYGSVSSQDVDSCFVHFSSSDAIYRQYNTEQIGKFDYIRFAGSHEYQVNKLSADYGIDGIQLHGESKSIVNSRIMRMTSIGILISAPGVSLSQTVLSQIEGRGVYTMYPSELHSLIILNTDEGVFFNGFGGLLSSSYLAFNQIGTRVYIQDAELYNNVFDRNYFAIAVCASDPIIQNNWFLNNNYGIEMNHAWSGNASQYLYCNPQITLNDFIGEDIFISLRGRNAIGTTFVVSTGVNSDQHYTNNYFNKQNLMYHLYDSNYPNSNVQYTIEYIPRSNVRIQSAGIH